MVFILLLCCAMNERTENEEEKGVGLENESV